METDNTSTDHDTTVREQDGLCGDEISFLPCVVSEESRNTAEFMAKLQRDMLERFGCRP